MALTGASRPFHAALDPAAKPAEAGSSLRSMQKPPFFLSPQAAVLGEGADSSFGNAQNVSFPINTNQRQIVPVLFVTVPNSVNVGFWFGAAR